MSCAEYLLRTSWSITILVIASSLLPLALLGCAKPRLESWHGSSFSLCCPNSRCAEEDWKSVARENCPDGIAVRVGGYSTLGGVISNVSGNFTPSGRNTSYSGSGFAVPIQHPCFQYECRNTRALPSESAPLGPSMEGAYPSPHQPSTPITQAKCRERGGEWLAGFQKCIQRLEPIDCVSGNGQWIQILNACGREISN